MRSRLHPYLAALALALAAVPVAAAPAQADLPYGCRSAAIRSVDKNTYVKTDLAAQGDLNGRLRAGSTTIGSAEIFEVCRVPATPTSGIYWTIRSTENHRYVSAEFGYTGNLLGLMRARATAVGPWEQFDLPGWTGWLNIRTIAFNRIAVLETAPAEIAGNLTARSAFRSPPRTWELVFDNLCRDTGCEFHDPYDDGCATNPVEVDSATALDGSGTAVKIYASTVCPGYSWAEGVGASPDVYYLLTFNEATTPTAPRTSWDEMLCCTAPGVSGPNTGLADDSHWVWACIRPYESPVPDACTARH
ncbi:hypothetical protein F4553_007691 [Allocatelliglobosispora scoriae]|uniref:Uncharacterized protein n=1 Tax=Allocatelliglobosispora scoriae TaxID=643052 RepID=A0A841BYN2_9ACTN|nr:hypothetical protein [Allocatelliglobosispora scoriae]MBB5874257.1 hypothetical protein [Allocatelliglobosispora scoriae]